MTETLQYTVQEYSWEMKNIFKGVYNDFKMRAFTDYKFELEPLNYDDFIASVEADLIKCIVLLEDSIPTAFMVYTTEISESLELNIIHCLGKENNNQKRKLLMDKFMEINKDIIQNKVVTFPMLGTQEEFTPEITNYGFNLVGIAVERFGFNNEISRDIFNSFTPKDLPDGYKIELWNDKYKEDVVNVINSSFKNTTDAKFDPRFASIEGCKDILSKITCSIYGKFLPDCTSVLLYKDKPIGLCFTNITAGRIANIPLVGIIEEHCGKGLGKTLLHNSLNQMITKYSQSLLEINVSTETDNYAALNMYRRLGFKEDYYYTQAYTTINN